MEELMLPPLAYLSQDNNTTQNYEIYLFKHNLKQEVNNQLERYISTLKHDIKTPVIAQIHALEHLLAESKERFNEKQQDILTSILESCNIQYTIINNLISMMKYKQEEIVLNSNSFDFIEILKDNLLSLTGQNRVKLKLTTPKAIVNADKEKLNDALQKICKYISDKTLKGSTINISEHENETLSHIIIEIFCQTVGSHSFSYDSGKKVYIDSTEYNSVGSYLEFLVASEIIKAHRGRLTIDQTGDSCLIKIKIPLH